MIKKLFIFLAVLSISLAMPAFAFDVPTANYVAEEGGIDDYTKAMFHFDEADTHTFTLDNANDNNDGNNVVLFEHFDGADTATNCTDASASEHDETFILDAQLDITQKRFGSTSLLCDGTGDYVTFPDSADFNLGAGDFTIDSWFFSPVADASAHYIGGNWGASSDYGWTIGLYGAGDLIYFSYSTTGSNNIGLDFPCDLANSTWYHLAFVRNGNDLKFYINGIQSGNTKDVTGVTIFASVNGLEINALNGTASTQENQLDDFRIIKGTLWTSNFTAPTVSPSPKLVTFVGEAQIDTAQYKDLTGSTASLLLDGSGDRVDLLDSDDWAFGDGAFTLDFWLRFSDRTTSNIFYRDDSNTKAIWLDFINGSNELRIALSTDGSAWTYDLTFSWNPSDDTWYHVAIVRTEDNIMAFIDGTQIGSTEAISGVLNDNAGPILIGFNVAGWQDEFRISKGIARDWSVARRRIMIVKEKRWRNFTWKN